MKFEQLELEEKVEFLKSMPCFHKWNRVPLCKFSYYCVPTNYKMNQVLIKEGEPLKHVFIVKSGEFEMSKRISYIEEGNNKRTKSASRVGYRQRLNH